MAIPEWTWPGDGTARAAPPELRVDDAAGVFDLISDPTRLEILLTLSRRSEPVSYTEFRESTSVDDNGRLNYHLRRLEPLLRTEAGRYAVTPRAAALVRTLVDRRQ